MNRQANRIIYKNFSDKGIFICELRFDGCDAALFLAAAHRKKRRHYRTVDELADFKESVLACGHCHNILDNRAKTTQEKNDAIFDKLRK